MIVEKHELTEVYYFPPSFSIESESDDYTVDSRRIVRLNLTATDKPQ